MTVANYFTFLRLLICPFFLLIYIYPHLFGLEGVSVGYVLLCLFFLSELSDAIDGYVARKLGQVSDLGKILDPMADSIARTAAFLTFTQPPVSLPIVFVFIFIYRDSVVSTLRTVCALKGIALAARLSGKVKAVIQAIAIFVILLLMVSHAKGEVSLSSLQLYSVVAVVIAALYTIYSCLEYIFVNRHYIRQLLHRVDS